LLFLSGDVELLRGLEVVRRLHVARQQRLHMTQQSPISWTPFYDRVQNGGPDTWLPKVLALIDREKRAGARLFAVDLGCGEGRDTRELLKRGWRVLAVDSEPEAIERLRKHPDTAPHLDRLSTLTASMSEASLEGASLIYSFLALPYVPKQEWTKLWNAIGGAITCGAYFAGNLFGDRHHYAAYEGVNVVSESVARALFEPFDVLRFETLESKGIDASGAKVNNHEFRFVIRAKD